MGLGGHLPVSYAQIDSVLVVDGERAQAAEASGREDAPKRD
jgi:hypothetical protein